LIDPFLLPLAKTHVFQRFAKIGGFALLDKKEKSYPFIHLFILLYGIKRFSSIVLSRFPN
jgi:hypothetical protein